MRQADLQHEDDAGGEASGGDGVRMEVISAPSTSGTPQGWHQVGLLEIAAKRANATVGGPFGSDLVAKDYVHSGVPVIRGQNMGRGFVSGEFAFVTPAKAKTLQANLAKPLDLVFTQRGTLGQVALVPRAPFDEYLISQSQMKLTVDAATADPVYIYQYFSSEFGQRQILDSAIQTGVPHTNLGILRSYKLLMPQLVKDQRAIAEALTDADALIDSLEQLLTKKRQIKQGAMQELLTGKRRLPGFSQPWRNVGLDQLGSFLKGAGIRRDEASSGDLPCVRYGEIYTVHSDSIRTFQSWISPAVASTATKLQRGDLLFAGSGETKEEIGKCVAVLDDFVAFAGGDIVILRPNSEVNAMFMGYLLNTPVVVRQKASRGQGDAVVHISAAALRQVSVDLPEPSEQTAIAQVLSDIDTDLAALESRLTKARALKQAMAQALLIGRIRLVKPTT